MDGMTKIIFPNPTTAVSTGEENLQVCIGRVRPARRLEQRSEAMGGRAGNKYAQIRLRSSVATHVKVGGRSVVGVRFIQ